ncbi:MAG: hypothetical protein EPN93_09395 [Spirochaetes bacterium]|nr:MAG: hypothetical protein EPN93_09395 [Spirochaetota bacterium]
MDISEKIDRMIAGLETKGLSAEYVVMGRNTCVRWLAEQAARGTDIAWRKARAFHFRHGSVPVVVCESEILEVLPNARYLLDDTLG